MSIWWARRTSTGVVYILFLILTTGAAVNTGNNTLYMTAATMMGILIVSGIIALSTLSALKVKSLRYEEIFASQQGEVLIQLSNSSRWLKVQGIEINGEPAPAILPGKDQWLPIRVSFPKRGIVQTYTCTVRSTYPFGFFMRQRSIVLHQQIMVYPSPLPSRECSSLLDKGVGELTALAHFAGERQFKSLKQFQQGDDRHSIHWKKSAQQQKLIAKEYTYLQSGKAIFLIPEGGSETEFETIISRITYCILLALREGRSVGLLHGKRRIEPGTGFLHRQKVLSYLALVTP